MLLDLVGEGPEEVIDVRQGILDGLALLPVGLAFEEFQVVEDVVFVFLDYEELERLQQAKARHAALGVWWDDEKLGLDLHRTITLGH